MSTHGPGGAGSPEVGLHFDSGPLTCYCQYVFLPVLRSSPVTPSSVLPAGLSLSPLLTQMEEITLMLDDIFTIQGVGPYE